MGFGEKYKTKPLRQKWQILSVRGRKPWHNTAPL